MAKQKPQTETEYKNENSKEVIEFKLNPEWPLLKRLANFHAEDIVIPKSRKAYGYNYADLDSILEIIRPLLVKHGISYVHFTMNAGETKELSLFTKIYNVDKVEDEIISETIIDENVSLAKMNKYMVVGSAITYYRRYHLVTMLGLTTDEDTDAGGKPTQTNSGSQNNPTSKAQGRSVDAASGEATVDYVNIFKNQVARNKTKNQLNKMLETYKKNMSPEILKQVQDIISKVEK